MGSKGKGELMGYVFIFIGTFMVLVGTDMMITSYRRLKEIKKEMEILNERD